VVSGLEQQNLGKVCSDLCDPIEWKAWRADAKSVFFLISILSLFSICHDTSAQYAPTTQASFFTTLAGQQEAEEEEQR
jgi:hypothetical protein